MKTNRVTKILIYLIPVVLVVAAGIALHFATRGNGNEKPTPVPTAVTPSTIPTDTVTPTPEPSPTETPVPTNSPTPTPTEEVTPSPTEEATPTPTEEPTPEPTEEPTPESTETPTVAPTDSPTPVPTNTATPVPTKEPTKVPTNAATPVPTKEPTKEPTKVPTNTPTNAPTPTQEVIENPITMWVAVDDFAVYDKDVYFSSEPHKLQKIDNQGKKRGDTVVVIRRNVNQASSEQSYIDEVQWGSGTALVRENHLSKTKIEPVWAEPRERTDIENALARLIDNYRAQNGIRKVENPYIYYELDNPGIGDYLTSKALRVAKQCCMEGTANHEGGQIGTGIYGNTHATPMNAEECANALFQNWYNSPAHRANLLDNKDADTLVLVGTVKVVEWYNGYGYQYCAIQGISYVEKAKLPDGLE